MASDSWFDGAELTEREEEVSAGRRSNPLKCYCEFLNDVLMQNSEDEALCLWRHLASVNPRYAEDALFCMEQVLSYPPSDIAGLLEAHAGIILYQPGPDAIPFTCDETVEWLKDFMDQCRRIFIGPEEY